MSGPGMGFSLAELVSNIEVHCHSELELAAVEALETETGFAVVVLGLAHHMKFPSLGMEASWLHHGSKCNPSTCKAQ